jgi:hypothetical protein
LNITKETVLDKMIIKGNGEVSIKEKVIFKEGGKHLGTHVEKRFVYPGDDFEKEADAIKEIIRKVHTADKIKKYKDEKNKTSM